MREKKTLSSCAYWLSMLECPGLGCRFKAKNDSGLSNHTLHCPKAAASLARFAKQTARQDSD
jgi:hypothetical protein